jgi:hypothetical protein
MALPPDAIELQGLESIVSRVVASNATDLLQLVGTMLSAFSLPQLAIACALLQRMVMPYR